MSSDTSLQLVCFYGTANAHVAILMPGTCSQLVALNEDSLLTMLHRGVPDALNMWLSMQNVCVICCRRCKCYRMIHLKKLLGAICSCRAQLGLQCLSGATVITFIAMAHAPHTTLDFEEGGLHNMLSNGLLRGFQCYYE